MLPRYVAHKSHCSPFNYREMNMNDHITGKATLTTIEIIVDSKGATTLQTRGFAGTTCREASRWLEAVVGQVLTDQATPEFYQSQDNSARAQQREA